MIRMRSLAGLLIATSLVAAPAAAQQFYKWKDASGATHYSDRLPDKASAKTVNVKHPHNSVPTQAAPIATTGKALDDAEAAYRRRSCLAARANLNILKGQGAVVDGKSVATANVLTTQRRAVARDEALANIDKFCEPEG
jgi:uncharacterized protein DUF4124